MIEYVEVRTLLVEIKSLFVETSENFESKLLRCVQP